MSTTSPARNADLTHRVAFFEQMTSLFTRAFRSVPVRQADASDVWALYQLASGLDSVSPAVERRLAEAAAR
jgi:hypothetical protein